MASELATLQAIRANNNLNPVQATRLRELEASGASGNPQGIESPTGSYLTSPIARNQVGNAQVTGFNQPTIDLPSIYTNLTKTSGISDKQALLTQRESEYLAARAKISDNPFTDATTIDKRLKRLEAKYATETQPLREEIALKNADIQTQLNLQSQQFNINSQQSQLALSQFNSLVSAGAFDNADVNSIANASNATGLSTSMIQSIINARAKANKPKVNTQVISYDDGKNQGYAVVNQDTGEVINKQVIAASKPKEATATATKESEQMANTKSLTTDIKAGVTLRQLVGYYGNVLSIDDIYRNYNIYSPYGQAKETIDDVKQGIFVS